MHRRERERERERGRKRERNLDREIKWPLLIKRHITQVLASLIQLRQSAANKGSNWDYGVV